MFIQGQLDGESEEQGLPETQCGVCAEAARKKKNKATKPEYFTRTRERREKIDIYTSDRKYSELMTDAAFVEAQGNGFGSNALAPHFQLTCYGAMVRRADSG